jgi:PAS domain S-box-containing protein
MWATVSSFAYLFLGIFRFWGEGPLLTEGDIAGGFPAGVAAHPLLDVFFPLSLFYLVALTIGYISSRLDREGEKVANLGRELRRLSLESSDILYNIPTGVLTCDLAGRLIFANPAGLRLLALEGEPVIGRPVRTVLGLRWKALREIIARTLEEGTPVLRAEIAAAGNAEDTGGAAHLGVSTSLLRDLNGETLGVTAIFQDISHRRRIETLSRRTLRLKALTELSASMAREIRDPMAAIRSTLDRLEHCEAPEERRRLLDVIRNETGRLSGLLDDFLRFARIRVREWRRVDLLKLIEEIKTLVMVRPDVASRIAFYLDGFQGEGRDVVWGDPELLKQVFLNLFVNAAEAIAGHGKIRVRFEGRASGAGGGGGEPDYLRVLVEDDGPGLKEEIAERVFDPFFSTKEDGAGLGLAIAHRIIEAHRGRIEIRNRRGKGCRCTLELPARKPLSGGN